MQQWLVCCAAFVLILASAASAATYHVDSGHSSAIFRVKHANAAYLYGRITAPEGTIEYDPAQPASAAFDIALKAANVNTDNAGRDNQLKSPTFFNARDYPTLTFKSTTVKPADDGALDVTGDLTIRGVTRSVTVHMDRTDVGGDNPRIVGFEGTFTINRGDFDMKAMPGMVGEEVRITVSFEGRAR